MAIDWGIIMSLNFMHGIFIIVCIMMSSFTAYWSVHHHSSAGLALSVVGVLGLLSYLVLFFKRIAVK